MAGGGVFGVERTGPRTTTRTSGRSIVVSYGCDQRSPSGAGCKKSSRYSKLLFFPPSSSFHKDEDLKQPLFSWVSKFAESAALPVKGNPSLSYFKFSADCVFN